MAQTQREMQNLRSRRGFSLIESLVAVSMLAIVSIIVTQLVHKNIVANFWNGQMKKAAGLADQVFEKYDYLASVQFATLEQLNQTHAAAADFFATGTNSMGYDKMWITTVVDPAVATGSRKLTVQISWGDEGPGKFISFTKFLSATPGEKGGAPVHVYVVDSAGVGVGGFEVRAAHHADSTYRNSMGTNEVIGFTDTNGFVTLLNVSVDPALQPMAVYAQKPGSDATVLRSDTVNFVQGYYAPGNLAANTKHLTVTQTTANVLQFDMRQGDFTALKSLSGTLHNASSGPDGGMSLSLQGTMSDGTTLSLKTATFTTATGGIYEFNNLAPGTLTLSVLGRTGSAPTIITTDPSFVQGYAGSGGNGDRPWIYQTTMASPAADISAYDVSVRTLGSLALVATSGGSPVPGASVVIQPTYQFPNWGYPMTLTTNGSGAIALNNVFAGNAEAVTYDAVVAPTGCLNPGKYLYAFSATAAADTSNAVSLLLKNGGSVSGVLTGTVLPATALSNVQVSAKSLVAGASITGTTDASGNFALCGISPEISTINPSWPSISLTLTDPTRKVAGTFSGRVMDVDSGALMANVPVSIGPNIPAGGYLHNVDCASDPSPLGAGAAITANASGQYGPICAYFPWQTSISVSASGGPSSFATGTVSVSTTVSQGGLRATAGSSYYYDGGSYLSVSLYETYTLDLRPQLRRQNVSGVVVESGTGRALAGISVQYACHCTAPGCDLTPNCSVTTDSSGSYGPLYMNVSGRTATNNGWVTVQTLDGATSTTTGGVYQNSTVSQNEAASPVPSVPVAINVTLTKYAGGL